MANPNGGPSRAAADRAIRRHVEALRACELCPRMHRPSVSGGPVLSPVLLVGQAPGDKEPKLGRPFAWTAGKTLFKWFHEGAGLEEAAFRGCIYMAAVCRCFPGKRPAGGDRVPDRDEIENCGRWLDAEIRILRPRLVLAVGKLAIEQFVPYTRLDELVGRKLRAARAGVDFDLVPLPHPSGASPWPRVEPGRTLVAKALRLIARHEAFRDAIRGSGTPGGASGSGGGVDPVGDSAGSGRGAGSTASSPGSGRGADSAGGPARRGSSAGARARTRARKSR